MVVQYLYHLIFMSGLTMLLVNNLIKDDSSRIPMFPFFQLFHIRRLHGLQKCKFILGPMLLFPDDITDFPYPHALHKIIIILAE